MSAKRGMLDDKCLIRIIAMLKIWIILWCGESICGNSACTLMDVAFPRAIPHHCSIQPGANQRVPANQIKDRDGNLE